MKDWYRKSSCLVEITNQSRDDPEFAHLLSHFTVFPLLNASATKRYNAFQVSCNAKITVRKHASTEHTAMNLLKRLWHWYSNRRTERRMLKGHGVYRTQTNQSHIPGKKMPTLPISTSS